MDSLIAKPALLLNVALTNQMQFESAERGATLGRIKRGCRGSGFARRGYSFCEQLLKDELKLKTKSPSCPHGTEVDMETKQEWIS
jgi:hypothetical protein